MANSVRFLVLCSCGTRIMVVGGGHAVDCPRCKKIIILDHDFLVINADNSHDDDGPIASAAEAACKYPNLCSGDLAAVVDGIRYVFPPHSLVSGGGISFDDEWNGEVSTGEWSVGTWPAEIPESIRGDVLEAINEQIEHGCCGGCA